MGFLDLLKRNKKEAAAERKPQQKAKPEAEAKKKKVAKKTSGQKSTGAKKDTKQAYKVLLRPLVTEKATATGTYYFAVNPKTNKQEIKKAVQVLYGVDPIKVNIVNFGGKKVRWGRSLGSTKAWKKAIVTLKAGQSIEIFEGV